MSAARLCSLFMLAFVVVAPAAEPKRIYSSDFEHEAGEEWSKREVSRTPVGARPFLGPFGGESITVTLAELPPHKLIRLEFDLYIINPVDGSSPIWGPDVWDLSIVDGPTLLHTTFDNCCFFTNNNEQAFPDEFPCKPHPGWTGATEQRTLGYVHSWGPQQTWDCSSVYHFVMTFPHEKNAFSAKFTSFSKEDKEGEAWGLAHVRIDAPPRAPGADKLSELWDQLGSRDAVQAFEAKWALIGRPLESLPFLRSRLNCGADEEREVTKLIDRLDDADPAVRKRATAELLRHGAAAAVPVLVRAARGADNPPETRARLTAVMQTFISPHGDDVEAWRRTRAIHAFEIILGLPNEARQSALELPRTNGPPGTSR